MNRIIQNEQAVSNVIVVMLSLVLVVVIAANVILWSYQMNQLDWERMQEDLRIMNVTPISDSPWSVTQSEYSLNVGSLTNGTYVDTQTINNISETFEEGPGSGIHEIDLNGTFRIDLENYPFIDIETIEIQLTYRANDTWETFFLETYNWTASTYGNFGFNNTLGHTPTTGWDTFTVNLTDEWRSYVNVNGIIFVKFRDSNADNNQTTLDIDFFSVRAVLNGSMFTFKNMGSMTCHLVSLWINNSTHHLRYDIDLFINAGDTLTFFRSDVSLPEEPHIIKVVTEKGNTSIYS